MGVADARDGAAREAQRLAGEVAAGLDPAQDKQDRRRALTMSELFDMYLDEALAGRILGRGGRPKKAGTIAFDEGAIRAHFAPPIGECKVVDITRRDVEKIMHAIAERATARTIKGKRRGLGRVTGGRGIATRTLGLLGGIMSFAVSRELRDDNPCARIAASPGSRARAA